MGIRPDHSWLLLASLLVLASCARDAGTPCRADHHCFSNSCTFGSCDGYLAAGIGRALEGDSDDSDDSSFESGERDASVPEATSDCPWLCEVLTTEHSCEEAAGCHAEWSCRRPDFCFSAACLAASCSSSASRSECESPCEWQVRCVGDRQCDYP